MKLRASGSHVKFSSNLNAGFALPLAMRHYTNLDRLSLPGAWLTVGAFDGVHRGHQALIQHLTAGAHLAGLPAAVLTFYPHPAVVLRNLSGMYYLTPPEEKAECLGKLGVDYVITYGFSRQVANRTAREFLSEVHQSLRFSHLLIGYDFALGRGREGNAEVLREIGLEYHYTVDVLAPINLDGAIISSSQVRKALSEGQVEQAARLLGRAYQVTGQVVHGDGRGRTIGIPTANLQVSPEKFLPQSGVYVGQVEIDGKLRGAVANLGYRPTFEQQTLEPRLEVHLLDFDQDLYGKQFTLSFIARLRDEQRFASISELVAQIQSDIQRGRQILANSPGLK